jgi:hypothetical protein
MNQLIQFIMRALGKGSGNPHKRASLSINQQRALPWASSREPRPSTYVYV